MYRLLFLILLVSYSNVQGQSVNINNELSAYYKDGGVEGFQNYLRKNLIIPDSRGLFKAQGKMYVSFSIDSTGNNSIEEIRNDIIFTGDLMEKSAFKRSIFIIFCENDIKRVFASMPKWMPKTENNVPIKSKLTVPINITSK